MKSSSAVSKYHILETFFRFLMEAASYIGTGPHSAVGNVSSNRCKSAYKSRGREFDPGPVPYFRGD